MTRGQGTGDEGARRHTTPRVTWAGPRSGPGHDRCACALAPRHVSRLNSGGHRLTPGLRAQDSSQVCYSSVSLPLVSEFPSMHCKNIRSWPPTTDLNLERATRDSVSSGIFHDPDETCCHVQPAEAEPLCTVTPLPARLCSLLAKQPNSDRHSGLVRLSPPRLPPCLPAPWPQ